LRYSSGSRTAESGALKAVNIARHSRFLKGKIDITMSWSHPEGLAEKVQATGVFGCFVDPKADGVVSGYTKALDGPAELPPVWRIHTAGRRSRGRCLTGI
jgi:hypothetical protein